MANPLKYRLTYFNARALAEPIRWMFQYTRTPFVDERLPWDYVKWRNQSKKNFDNTVGQIPVFHEEGKPELSQSQVISRYLAKKFDLIADNDWDLARCDEVISLVYDLFILWRDTGNIIDSAVRQEAKARLDDKFQLYYAKFNNMLEETEGDFIAGNKMTHADFWLASLISIWDDPMTGDIFPVIHPGMQVQTEAVLYVDMTKKFPALRKHKELLKAIPQIKEWNLKRPQTVS